MYFINALCIFLPTVWISSQTSYIFLILLFIFTKGEKVRFYRRDAWLILFILAVIFNYLSGFFLEIPRPYAHSWRALGIPLMMFCALIGRNIEKKAIQYLIFLITFESAICIIESVAGVPALFPGQTEAALANIEIKFGDSDLLYYNTVFGLSNNSSMVSLKLMLALFLSNYTLIERWQKVLITTLLLLGLVVTFNRTAITCVGVFYVFLFIQLITEKGMLKHKIYMSIFACLIIFVILFNQERVIVEYLRGDPGATVVESSGRKMFWEEGVKFILENPFFGNRSNRFMIETYYPYYVVSNTHNSILQIIADNGFVASLFLFCYVLSLVRRANLIYFIPLIMYNMVQFGLFYNISFMDILFYYLLNPKGKSISLKLFSFNKKVKNTFVGVSSKRLPSGKIVQVHK